MIPGLFIPQENMKSFSNPIEHLDLDQVARLDNLFGRYPEFFSELCSREASKTDAVPETTSSNNNRSVPSNSSLKRANANVVGSSKATWCQSSGSTLPPELEMGLVEAFRDLVSRNMLGLVDVAHAESYLAKSTWASYVFLLEEDHEKRAVMIISARKNSEEKNKRRKIGACDTGHSATQAQPHAAQQAPRPKRVVKKPNRYL